MSLLGLILIAVLLILLAVLVAPRIPHPGGQVLSILCWVLLAVLIAWFVIGLVGAAAGGVGTGPVVGD